MKRLAKTIKGYSFNELEYSSRSKAKKNVLEKENLPELFSEDLRETLLEKFGLRNLCTYFSLSYSQGDGLCLYGIIKHYELFHNEHFREIAFSGIHHKQIKSVYEELERIVFFHRGKYYHAKTVSIESREHAPSDKQIAIIDKIVANVKSWYFSFCAEWEKRGYDYFYEISDEDMENLCNENDYLFTIEGTLINRQEYLEVSA